MAYNPLSASVTKCCRKHAISSSYTCSKCYGHVLFVGSKVKRMCACLLLTMPASHDVSIHIYISSSRLHDQREARFARQLVSHYTMLQYYIYAYTILHSMLISHYASITITLLLVYSLLASIVIFIEGD